MRHDAGERRGQRSKFNRKSRGRFERLALLSVGVAMALPAWVAATTYQWIGGSANWGTAANTGWSPTGLPNNGDTANVTNTLGLTQTITYNYTGTALTMNTLTLDALGGSNTGSETLSMAANNISATSEFVGDSGSASKGNALFNQSGGTNTAADLYLGDNPTDVGTYVISAGTLSVSSFLEVGFEGAGTINNTGGTNNISTLVMAVDPGANGTYNLNGGSLSALSIEYIGDQSSATFNQTNFTTNSTVTLYLGYQGSGSGNYQLNDSATLNVSGNEFIGLNGIGNLNIATSAANTIAGYLSIGGESGAVGTVAVPGGTLTAANIYAGGGASAAGGKGILTVSGGSVTTAGELDIYNTGGTNVTLSNGSLSVGSLVFNGAVPSSLLNWTGGTLSITNSVINVDNTSSANFPNGQVIGPNQSLNVSQNENIGVSGPGIMMQTGGLNTSDGAMYLGANPSEAGEYNLSGTGVLATNGAAIGYEGPGTFTQSGGAYNVASGYGIFIGYLSNVTGIYTMSGGTMTSNALAIGLLGNGSFNQSGGSVLLNSSYGVQIGQAAGGTGTFTLSGSGSLLDQDVEEIGIDGIGVFNQSGGTNTILNGSSVSLGVNTGSTGTYILSGGTATVSGDFLVSGGGGTSGVGVLNVSSGLLNVAGTLSIGNVGSSVVNFSGGTIEVGALLTNGIPSLLNWTAGTLEFANSATLDSGAGMASPSDSFGTALAIGVNQTLSVNSDLTLGGTGSFALTLNSGAIAYVGSQLTITQRDSHPERRQHAVRG
jgi:hypothetical protein